MRKDYPHINWTDGMKLNKDLFIAQDNAHTATMHNLISSTLSPVRYGLLPDEDNFNVEIAVDNQNTARVSIISCKAITKGGVYISIAPSPSSEQGESVLSFSLTLPSTTSDTWWVALTVQPYERIPYGTIDSTENPPRHPYVKPVYNVQLVSDHEFHQYAYNPYALIIGKLIPTGSGLRNDEEYIPPCISTNALQDLIQLHAELDVFLSNLEQACSQIVQKIYRKSQQNELSELAQFCCDRLSLYLGKAITDFRWFYLYESPVKMISDIVGLARVLKNTIDLRIGSGKEELMNYLSEWSELKQGELEALLTQMASMKYNHNDINQNIINIIQFAKVIGRLFTTLSNLEFIGKKKEAGIFVKEGYISEPESNTAPKPRRRFFG